MDDPRETAGAACAAGLLILALVAAAAAAGTLLWHGVDAGSLANAALSLSLVACAGPVLAYGHSASCLRFALAAGSGLVGALVTGAPVGAWACAGALTLCLPAYLLRPAAVRGLA